MSFGAALTTNIDVGAIAGGAVAGGIMGLGAAATGGMSILAQGGGGGLVGVVAGQADAATHAVVDQLIAGEGFGGSHFLERAQANGLGDPSKMLSDAVVGSASGLLSGVVGKVTEGIAGMGDFTVQRDPELVTLPSSYTGSGLGGWPMPGQSYTLPGSALGNVVRGVTSSNLYSGANEIAGNWLSDKLESAWESIR